MSQLKIAIFGALGRVGRRLCILALKDSECELVGVLTHSSDSNLGKKFNEIDSTTVETMKCDIVIQSSMHELKQMPDVVIDFSKPNGTKKIITECLEFNIPIVIGTTGFTAEEENTYIKNSEITEKIPILYSGNFSLGVNLLFDVVAKVAKVLNKNYDIEIIETHHNKKVDAPSGTAYQLADHILNATERTRSDIVLSRNGIVGEKKKKEIGIQSIRLGKVVGEHTVHFANDFERIEITHKAQDRDLFANGAIHAAKWIIKQKPNLYDMKNVLFD